LFVHDDSYWASAILAKELIKALPSTWKACETTHRGVGGRLERIHKRFVDMDFDVIYYPMWHYTRKFYKDFHSMFPNSKLKVGVSGYAKLGSSTYRVIMPSKHIDGVTTWCKKIYDRVKKIRDDVWLTYHGIDTEKFHPAEEPDIPFRVGWCGNVTHYMKRTRLFKDIDYPIVIAGRHLRFLQKPKWNVPNVIIYDEKPVPYKDMGKFYHGFHAYICTSFRETGPLPVLEAAASGLPIVSTNVGIVPELLEDEWVIHDEKPEVVVREMNRKIAILADNPELRRKVGEQNRKEIMVNWTFKKTIGKWVKFFEA